ncbi:glycosyltransferase family 9 protein [Vreelandella populi]|uniref:Lipopolysaccharide heptosyltransferase family protein n=1 Tax=Vreelandella populi TaxID=2498858 RepID=A0A3S1E9D3_9GAMM|nr:glycosyltransferase family 9 protein [Halomonas populi]RUR35800.1 lipopolysaccharide heptosyltransferase family protein [Halomonas populi]RUR47991.1 lipopolysaccharide heptosyltransferase family protein [Halomonas populi]
MAKKLLVVRNDKIGDFMLAWPALACLKSASPAPHITVLVPAYTAPLASACPWVDEVMIDPGSQAEQPAQKALLESVKSAQFDALLTLFSTPRIGWLGWRAGIPLRVAPATKWAQVFYNVRIRQRRSRSEKPEYQYNVDLACELLARLSLSLNALPTPPFWPVDDVQRSAQRKRLTSCIEARPDAPLVVVHPGSGGSAVNLSIDQYAALISNIDRQLEGGSANWLISAGPGEETAAQTLIDQLADASIKAKHVPASTSVADFAYQLTGADMLIAGSTGPLHIAGCLNIATAGFYPAKRSATPLRWQTCNSADRRLAFSPPASADQQDMSSIDIETAAQQISALLNR